MSELEAGFVLQLNDTHPSSTGWEKRPNSSEMIFTVSEIVRKSSQVSLGG